MSHCQDDGAALPEAIWITSPSFCDRVTLELAVDVIGKMIAFDTQELSLTEYLVV
jgi:hypothetical protein